MRFAQLVIGPAGCGKSTYCHVIQEACFASKRPCRVINLDPAAEEFKYQCYFDVRDMIKVEDVMEHFNFGPNGALMFCMEYLLKKRVWLEDIFDNQINDDDEFILIDLPGQIELYISSNGVMSEFVKILKRDFNYSLISVYVLDVTFVNDQYKLVSGIVSALSTMINLDVPHINVFSKYDLLSKADQEAMDELMQKTAVELINEQEAERMASPEQRRFMNALLSLIDEYSLVSFCCLNINDEESVEHVLLMSDMAIGYGEDQEPKEHDYLAEN